MPRIRPLVRDPVKDRQEATRRIIRRGMIDQGIDRQVDMAKKIGMSQPSFSVKMKEGNWSLEEMVRVAQTLKLSEGDTAVILGVK